MVSYIWKKENVPSFIKVTQVYGVAFSDDKQILLRIEDGKYKLTGGKPKPGENFEMTLIREYLEELNTEIEDIYYLGYLLVKEDSKKPYAQVRMIAKIKKVNKSIPDLDNNKVYGRYLANIENVKKYLNYPDKAGNALLDDAINMAENKYHFNKSIAIEKKYIKENNMQIREKKKEDCKAWVEINVQSWQDNLKGVVSDNILNTLLENKEKRIKNDIASFKSDNQSFVLEDNNKIIGIMKLVISKRVGYENAGEVQMLYLLTSKKGKGYGKALINKAFTIFKNKGYHKVVIGCIKGNPANGFYKHLKGKLMRQEPIIIFGETYNENIYEFDI